MPWRDQPRSPSQCSSRGSTKAKTSISITAAARKAGQAIHIQRWANISDLLVLSRGRRSEEHTSELQSPCNLVCRLLLEKKKNKISDDENQIEVGYKLPYG